MHKPSPIDASVDYAVIAAHSERLLATLSVVLIGIAIRHGGHGAAVEVADVLKEFEIGETARFYLDPYPGLLVDPADQYEVADIPGQDGVKPRVYSRSRTRKATLKRMAGITKLLRHAANNAHPGR